MKNTTMRLVWYFLSVFFLLLQGCGVLFYREEDERKRQEAEYRPYQQQNTIAAYQEFMKKYPDNLFVSEAKCTIELLQFSPYEQKDTIDGYREFMKSYPSNRNASRAVEKIDQLEFKQAEDADTIAAYREFLRQHPRSNYIMLAQQRLQDLEFRDLDTTCQKQFKFDLLLYRLNVNRLQQQLKATNPYLTDFILFASLPQSGGRRCFTTKLIYGDVLLRLNTTIDKSSELFFNAIITKLLVYLDQKFTLKKDIDGFCFIISSSASSFDSDSIASLHYYFSVESVHQFSLGNLKPGELFTQALINSSVIAAPAQETPAAIPASRP
jgi:hypothetical protein